MSRFFFHVDDAVDLILQCSKNRTLTAGRILSIPMKGVLIRRILEVWSQSEGFQWSTSTKRIGDRNLEYLIGLSELASTQEVILDSKKYFLMEGQGQLVKSPLLQEYSSVTATQMTNEEILHLVQNPPEEA
jgi:FlaA1/EpsC-like NDP-sugar epimerase